MNRRWLASALCALGMGLILVGCTWFGQQSLFGPQAVERGEKYILAFHKLPKDVEGTIELYGGSVRAVLEEIDAVLVTGDARFLAAIEGVKGFDAAIPDVSVDWLPGIEPKRLGSEHIGDDEWFFPDYQWDMLAIDAPGAWDAGYTGAGVRVAVLDTGIDYTHPDLAGAYVGGYDFANDDPDPMDDDQLPDGTLLGHGSNVAGIIAAADNAYGVIGVAPNAEILAVKVLNQYGSGDFGWMLEGILYAVEHDADVINMSLGAYMSHNGYIRVPNAQGGYDEVHVGASAIAGFVNLVRKTLNFAEQQGVFLVASAGNGAFDGTGDGGWMHVPSDVGCTAVVSATGPIGWAYSHDVDLDLFAFYSDYGSQIDFAAPGGNADFSLPLYHYDFVLNCFIGGWGWMAGTSQASPHVAGVAALIIEKNGGPMEPAHVARELCRSADDLGKPGQDPYFGHGRINAARAVGP